MLDKGKACGDFSDALGLKWLFFDVLTPCFCVAVVDCSLVPQLGCARLLGSASGAIGLRGLLRSSRCFFMVIAPLRWFWEPIYSLFNGGSVPVWCWKRLFFNFFAAANSCWDFVIAVWFNFKISTLDNDFIYFTSPPPDLPCQGGGLLISLPWREGLEGGG